MCMCVCSVCGVVCVCVCVCVKVREAGRVWRFCRQCKAAMNATCGNSFAQALQRHDVHA